jgi:fatty acid/phospholipid biosynthesis enzyme
MSITPNAQRRQALLFGRQMALRAISDAIDQLQAELHAEREQHAFNVAELEKQIAKLLRELMQARLELVRRDRIDALTSAPSPSAMMH